MPNRSKIPLRRCPGNCSILLPTQRAPDHRDFGTHSSTYTHIHVCANTRPDTHTHTWMDTHSTLPSHHPSGQHLCLVSKALAPSGLSACSVSCIGTEEPLDRVQTVRRDPRSTGVHRDSFNRSQNSLGGRRPGSGYL